MQPQLCSFIMCDDIKTSGGKYSLLGVFYRVHVASFPSRYDCYVVVGWYGEEGQHEFEISFTGPEGEKLQSLPPSRFILSPAKPYHNALVGVGLTFSREGIYRFHVFVNGKMCGSFPLHVELVPAGKPQ